MVSRPVAIITLGENLTPKINHEYLLDYFRRNSEYQVVICCVTGSEELLSMSNQMLRYLINNYSEYPLQETDIFSTEEEIEECGTILQMWPKPFIVPTGGQRPLAIVLARAKQLFNNDRIAHELKSWMISFLNMFSSSIVLTMKEEMTRPELEDIELGLNYTTCLGTLIGEAGSQAACTLALYDWTYPEQFEYGIHDRQQPAPVNINFFQQVFWAMASETTRDNILHGRGSMDNLLLPREATAEHEVEVSHFLCRYFSPEFLLSHSKRLGDQFMTGNLMRGYLNELAQFPNYYNTLNINGNFLILESNELKYVRRAHREYIARIESEVGQFNGGSTYQLEGTIHSLTFSCIERFSVDSGMIGNEGLGNYIEEFTSSILLYKRLIINQIRSQNAIINALH